MATSVVTICNLALSLIGDRANLTSIDPPEGSAQADYCAQFWPIARDEALSMHDWGFARRSAELAVFSTEDHPGWAYAFARPTDFLVALALEYPESAQVTLSARHPTYEEGTLSNGQPVFYTDTDQAVLRYTRIVSDPTRYPPKFVTGLSHLLASYLAGAVVKGRSGVGLAQTLRQQAVLLLNEAAAIDANQSHETTRFNPSAVAARRSPGADGYIAERGVYRHELPFWARS